MSKRGRPQVAIPIESGITPNPPYESAAAALAANVALLGRLIRAGLPQVQQAAAPTELADCQAAGLSDRPDDIP